LFRMGFAAGGAVGRKLSARAAGRTQTRPASGLAAALLRAYVATSAGQKQQRFAGGCRPASAAHYLLPLFSAQAVASSHRSAAWRVWRLALRSASDLCLALLARCCRGVHRALLPPAGARLACAASLRFTQRVQLLLYRFQRWRGEAKKRRRKAVAKTFFPLKKKHAHLPLLPAAARGGRVAVITARLRAAFLAAKPPRAQAALR